MTIHIRAALCLAVAAAHNATAVHHAASRGGRSRATTSLLVVVAIVFCAVAACVKSHRTTLAEPEPEKPIDVDAVLDEESKEGPDELSESRHAKPVKPVEAVPAKVRAVSFDIEQPVANPLTESRASASKWSLVKPS